MHHPTDRIAHTTAFVTPVVELWLERVYCSESFQDSQPPLFESIVTDETVVVQSTAPDDTDPSTRIPAPESASPEAHSGRESWKFKDVQYLF